MDIGRALIFEYCRVLAVVRAIDGLFIFLASYLMCRHMVYFTSETPAEITTTKALGLAIVSFQLSFLISLSNAARYVTYEKISSYFATVVCNSALTALGVFIALCTPNIIAVWCTCVLVTTFSSSRLVKFDIGIGLLSAVVSCIAVSILRNQFMFPEGIIVGAAASHIVSHRLVESLGLHLAADLAYKSHRSVTLDERRIFLFPRGRGALIDIITAFSCGLAAGPLIWFFHSLFNAMVYLVPKPYSSTMLCLMGGIAGCLCCGIMTFLSTDVELEGDAELITQVETINGYNHSTTSGEDSVTE